MTIQMRMIRILGVEQYIAYIIDTDNKVMHTLIRWSEGYAKRDAQIWISRFERGLRLGSNSK